METQLVLYYLLSWSVYYNTQVVGRLVSDGFWDQDYRWGVQVSLPFGARWRSSVRYGTRLRDLKESCFILLVVLFCFSTKSSTRTVDKRM